MASDRIHADYLGIGQNHAYLDLVSKPLSVGTHMDYGLNARSGSGDRAAIYPCRCSRNRLWPLSGKRQAVLTKLQELGGDAVFLAADLCDRETATRLVPDSIGHFARLDIPVNNAQGIPPLLELTDPRTYHDLKVALQSGLLRLSGQRACIGRGIAECLVASGAALSVLRKRVTVGQGHDAPRGRSFANRHRTPEQTARFKEGTCLIW
jgi:NAD(P)-dependent dehydrogenase (short-subunit alcohol dehydrogenase family)